MLAQLVDKPFDRKGWIFEIKWDGFRTLTYKDGKEVELLSRNNLSFNARFPTIVDEVKRIPFDVILDGEVVVMDEQGLPSFQLMQNYKDNSKNPAIYYVFDTLFLDGEDLRELPLFERKAALHNLLSKLPLPHIKISDYVEERGIDFFKAASKQHLEGIIAKRADSRYLSKRSGEWLKIKTHQRQEVVIGGYTEPKGSRSAFGALLVGVYKGKDLIYSGHVGGGFTQKLLTCTYAKLKPLITDKCPFSVKPKPNTKVTWLKPQVVCEVQFAEWTEGGQMRQPVFQGLREDKKPQEVVREEPKISRAEVKTGKTPKKATSAENEFVISNPDKLYWKKEKITKGDLLAYYEEVSDYILPYLANRPLMVKRYPEGIEGQSFYQKDMPHTLPSFMHSFKVHHEEKDVRYAVIDNLDSLLYIVNMGSIELHPFNTSVNHIENPDYMVLDLDPEGIDFSYVVEAAQQFHALFDDLKVPHFCKTSGATGLHIFVPLSGKYSAEQAQQLGQIFATLVHQEIPEFTSLERSPAKRKKKVYLDYLQNRWAQSVVCAYSVRARPLAPVSTPLEWSEVKKGLDPAKFTIKTIAKRLKQKGDLFKGVLGKGIDMEKLLKKIGKL